MYWVMNLHNLLKFLKLRMDNHAQYEIQVFANAIYEILCEIAPNIMHIWKSSSFDSLKITSEELDKLPLVANIQLNDTYNIEGWSKRRRESFIEKIRRLIKR
jgi:thymidylate synthase ThyX